MSSTGIKEHLLRSLAIARQVSDAVSRDLTDEQLNWIPPGTANQIGATRLHAIAGEDSFVQRVVRGEPLVWETGRWAAETGLTTLPGRGESWDEFRDRPLSLAALAAYEEAVRAATDAYLAEATDDDLGRLVTLRGNLVPVSEVLAWVVVHSTHHAGEIAALKGTQGARGLPF